MKLIVSAWLVIATLGLCQSPEDLLPEGVTLDAQGKLRWADFVPKPCSACKGEKLVLCPGCGEATKKGCLLCIDGKMRCRECGGTGLTADPCLWSDCHACLRSGIAICPKCDGKRVILSAASEEPCAACQLKGAFPCPLCAGNGRLRSIAIEGKDVRHLSMAQLTATRGALDAAMRVLESRGSLGETETRPLGNGEAVVSEVLRLAALPPGHAERLAAVVSASGPKGPEDFERSSAISSYVTGIDAYLEYQKALVDRAIWLLRKNSGGAPRLPRRKAAEIRWQSWFGEDPTDKSVSYSLLGRGFFRTPSAANTDEVIAAWLKAHPDATMVPVASLPMRASPLLGTAARDDGHIYVWVTDKSENLGLELVKLGCIPGGTMVAPRAEVDVDLSEYFKVMKEVVAAEAAAKAAKRGCWKELIAERDAEAHVAAARELQKGGKFADAVAEFQKAIDAGDSERQTLLDLGECLERLNRIAEALETYDKAIGDGKWWPPYISKAQCLERRDGVKAAVDFLSGLPPGEDGDRKVPYLLAWLHNEAGRPKDAIPHYETVLRGGSDKQQLKFDEQGWLILDPATLKKDTNDYAGLSSTLEELADCYWQTGQQDKALRAATMGISIRQQTDRDKSYLSKEQIESGNTLCRIIRARVYVARVRLEDARRELRFARISSDNRYPPWAAEIATLESKLKPAGTDSR